MALATQTIDLPFATGVSEKTYPALVEVGAQLQVTNGVFVKGGTIQKRPGSSPLAVYGSTLARLTSLGSGLFAIDGSASAASNVWGYSPTLAAWANLDQVGECNAWHEGVAEWTSGVTSFDVAHGNGYTVVVWAGLPYSSATNHVVYASVIDGANGNYVVTNHAVSAGAVADASHVRAIIVGTKCVVVVKDATTKTDVYAAVLDMTTMAWSATTKIVSDYDTAALDMGLWDIASSDATHWAIIYPWDVGAGQKTMIRLFDTGLTNTASSVAFGPPTGWVAPGHGYALAITGALIWAAIVYDDGVNETVFVSTWNSSTLAAILEETPTGVVFVGTAQIKIAIATIASSSTTAVVVASNMGNISVGTKYRTMDSAGTLGAKVHTTFGTALEGKPFVRGGRTYCIFGNIQTLVAYTGSPPVTQSSPQGSYMLVDLDENDATYTSVARVVANVAPRIANTAALDGMTTVTGVWPVSSTQWITLGSIVTSTSNRFGLHTITFDFAGDRWSGPELNGVRYMSGGVPSSFDGQRVTEIGFLHPPPTVSLTGGAGGALTANGTYTYLALYTWVDANGNIQRSASSIATDTLAAGKQSFVVSLYNCAFTNKQDPASGYNPPIKIQLYRNTDGGATFYQLFSDTDALVSDPNTVSQSYTDTMSDLTLAALGYGTWPFAGGALEGYCPPAMTMMVAYNLRLWGVGDDLETLWYSTSVLSTEQPRFSDAWRVPIGEPVTGLEVMDNALYVFTSTGILRIAGDGPNEENTQNSLQGPDIVTSDAGCIESRSVISTPLGIFFQAPAGIYLLARGGADVQYMGTAVEDTLADNPVIRSVELLPETTEIRWECAPTETSATGATICFNYTFKAWSVFVRTAGATTSVSTESAVVIDGVYYWGTAAGLVYQEFGYLDGTSWIPLTVASAWVKASGIIGWGRFRYVTVVADKRDAHDLTVSIATDYASAATQTHTFTADEMALWTTPLQVARVQVGQQKASAIKVTVSDAAPTRMAYSTGQGPILVGLQLEVGVMPRPARIPTRQGA